MAEAPSSPVSRVLFVDDDDDVLKAAALLLARNGFDMVAARNPAEAFSRLAGERVDVILLDLNFSRAAQSGEEGLRCLADILAEDPQAVVVVVTGHSGVAIAVAAMRAGASDFVMKPWRNERLIATLRAALELRRRRVSAADAARGDAEGSTGVGEERVVLGDSAAARRIRDLVRRAAPTDAAILIHGPAGAGKSLIARAIHHQSTRADRPLICVDLGAGDARVIETELFGDAAGTGCGALAEARGATLVLDEVSALTPALQARLLAALEGGRAAEVRLVSLTRQPLESLRGPAGLRADLLYRLSTVEIAVPPLAAREGDAHLLAEHFLRLYARRYGRPVRALSPEAAQAVTQAAWPGGVRALRQAMERAVVLAESERYEAADVLGAPEEGPPGATAAVDGRRRIDDLNLARSERGLVQAALERHGFNVSHAARDLGLTRAALYRRMAKHGL